MVPHVAEADDLVLRHQFYGEPENDECKDQDPKQNDKCGIRRHAASVIKPTDDGIAVNLCRICSHRQKREHSRDPDKIDQRHEDDKNEQQVKLASLDRVEQVKDLPVAGNHVKKLLLKRSRDIVEYALI